MRPFPKKHPLLLTGGVSIYSQNSDRSLQVSKYYEERRIGATFISGAAGGAAGGFTGDYANSVREGKEFNATTAGITAVTGGVVAGGAAESAGLHRAFSPMTKGQKYSVDVGINSSIPISGGVQANDAKDGVEDVDKSSKEIRSSGQKDAERIGNSSTDDIKDVFG